MTQQGFSDPSLQKFSGLAPLFPLPGCVLLPHALLPLHIFEPRYREMTAAVLEGEKLIAISLVRPGWRSTAGNGIPPIEPMVGLGKITAHERLDDGRYMLVLRGIARARMVHELPIDLPYRIGQLQIVHDFVPNHPDFDRRSRAVEIVDLFCRLFPGEKHQRIVHQALSGDLPLGSLCDVIASEIPFAPELAQMFLDERDSDVRSQMLWQLLNRMEKATETQKSPVVRRFPPHFSIN